MCSALLLQHPCRGCTSSEQTEDADCRSSDATGFAEHQETLIETTLAVLQPVPLEVLEARMRMQQDAAQVPPPRPPGPPGFPAGRPAWVNVRPAGPQRPLLAAALAQCSHKPSSIRLMQVGSKPRAAIG